MRVLVVFGTRPEAIKLAPVIRALVDDPRFECIVCNSGQHSRMLNQVLEVFAIQPDHSFSLMRPNQTLTKVTIGVLSKLEGVFASERPDLVIVQGDTTTAFASALAAYYHQVPVAHIEAGLRTGNTRDPFPEELNRVLADKLSDYLFAATERSKSNLLSEGHSKDRIWVTGNTGIDALLWIAARDADVLQPSGVSKRLAAQARRWQTRGQRLVLVTCHRRESFGARMEVICSALRDIAERNTDVEIVYPVHLNPNVWNVVNRVLANVPRVHLIRPLSYSAFVWLLGNAYLVLTDSGGIQEEAPALGKPVLVMRNTTERAEAIEARVARLVGVEREAIVAQTERLLNSPSAYTEMAKQVSPYGDGHATERILEVLMGAQAPVEAL